MGGGEVTIIVAVLTMVGAVVAAALAARANLAAKRIEATLTPYEALMKRVADLEEKDEKKSNTIRGLRSEVEELQRANEAKSREIAELKRSSEAKSREIEQLRADQVAKAHEVDLLRVFQRYAADAAAWIAAHAPGRFPAPDPPVGWEDPPATVPVGHA